MLAMVVSSSCYLEGWADFFDTIAAQTGNRGSSRLFDMRVLAITAEPAGVVIPPSVAFDIDVEPAPAAFSLDAEVHAFDPRGGETDFTVFLCPVRATEAENLFGGFLGNDGNPKILDRVGACRNRDLSDVSDDVMDALAPRVVTSVADLNAHPTGPFDGLRFSFSMSPATLRYLYRELMGDVLMKSPERLLVVVDARHDGEREAERETAYVGLDLRLDLADGTLPESAWAELAEDYNVARCDDFERRICESNNFYGDLPDTCGDGVLQPEADEECDIGAPSPTVADICGNRCERLIPPGALVDGCGDGIVDAAAGETCDWPTSGCPGRFVSRPGSDSECCYPDCRARELDCGTCLFAARANTRPTLLGLNEASFAEDLYLAANAWREEDTLSGAARVIEVDRTPEGIALRPVFRWGDAEAYRELPEIYAYEDDFGPPAPPVAPDIPPEDIDPRLIPAQWSEMLTARFFLLTTDTVLLHEGWGETYSGGDAEAVRIIPAPDAASGEEEPLIVVVSDGRGGMDIATYTIRYR